MQADVVKTFSVSQAKCFISPLKIGVRVEFDDSMLPVTEYSLVFYVARLTNKLIAGQTFVRGWRVFNVRLLALFTLFQRVK